MKIEDGTISVDQLLQMCAAQPERFMWFLGAGASRSANMPTASDLIWELKLRQYCREENQDIQLHDIANRQVRDRISERPWCCVTWGRSVPQRMRRRPKSFVNHGRSSGCPW
jgi:hypothetical protein